MGALHPLDLLPRDSWIDVLSHEEHPKDIWNVSKVHSQFCEIFQTVFTNKWKSAVFFIAFPSVSKFLCQKDCFNLRLVNKSTKLTVDYYLEREEIKAFVQTPKELELWSQTRGNYEDCSVLLSKMNSLPIAKIISLSVDYQYENATFPELLPFFQEFGSQIVKLAIQMREPDNADLTNFHPLENVKAIRDILLLTPRLKILNIWLTCRNEGLGIPCSFWVDQVTQFWTENPLPELSTLKDLQLDLFDFDKAHKFPSFASPTLQAFLQTFGKQLEELAIFESNFIRLPRMAMPHLKCLCISVNSIEELDNFMYVNAPLKEIRMYLYNDFDVTSKHVFGVLETFKETLVHVKLYHWNEILGKIKDLPDHVNLQKLEDLKLEGRFHGLAGPSFSFLENFSSLRKLTVELWAHEPVSKTNVDLEKTHLLPGCTMPRPYKFHCSRIWTLLPNLEQVEVIKGMTDIDDPYRIRQYLTFHKRDYCTCNEPEFELAAVLSRLYFIEEGSNNKYTYNHQRKYACKQTLYTKIYECCTKLVLFLLVLVLVVCLLANELDIVLG